MTQRTPPPSFGNFSYAGETDCTKQDFYGSYLLYFGDPPFSIDSLSDKLNATLYPFTAAANYMYPTPGPLINSRTDQALTTRQELLKLRSSLGFSQNVLQYMGTFSRERNWPAPDWPNLNPTGALSEGRFNLNNLDIVIPNPDDCLITHGKKKGWQTGKNKNHLCGSSADLINLFGLYWKKADTTTTPPTPGHWIYVAKDPPNGKGKIACLRGPNRQNDFFQILKYALFTIACSGDGDPDPNRLAKTFAIGASLIDEWDSGEQCPSSGNATGQPQGCDLDWRALDNGKWQKRQYTTHTTVIEWGNGGGTFAYGMEKDNRDDSVNGDWPYNDSGCKDCPHRPCGNNGGNCTGSETPGPIPVRGGPTPTQVVNRGFTTVGEFGYGIDTFTGGLPTLKFWDSSTTPPFQYAPVLDFFSYNPVSSAYPRAGIVNLYTKNAPVLAAILSRALETAAAANSNPPSPVVSGTPYAGSEAQRAADAIVAETQRVLAGSPTYGSVQQTDLTRAIAGRLTKAAIDAVPGWPSASDDTKNTVARAIAEIGQTRTWNLLIDVIAQTGKYAPGTTDVTDGTKFTVEGEKRYWLHIALGRDLIQADGTPCAPGVSTGCQVDVLGTQLEEVIDN
jgi:hypothetical protein